MPASGSCSTKNGRHCDRITLAFLFFQFGSAKWFAFPAAIMPGGGTAPIGTLAWWAGVIEVTGGLFILFGLFTRPVAFVLSGEMAFAYFIGHASQGPGSGRSSTRAGSL